MKKVKTYSEKIILIQDGLQVVGWRKKCPICQKVYETTSRSQKFCSNECCKKAQSKKLKYTKAYDQDKAYIRLASRAHSIGVEVMNLLVHEGLLEYKCVECGSTENLEVHHISTNFLDNSPENLAFLCPKCHHEVHTSVSSDSLKESGPYKDFYKLICK